jgi:hypothetical protein
MGVGHYFGGVNDARPFFGACSGAAAQRVIHIRSQDGAANANVDQDSDAALSYLYIDPVATTRKNTMAVASLDANGFTGSWVRGETVNWSNVGVLGLSGLLNAAVFSVALPGISGDFSVTGLSFKPNFVILFGVVSSGISNLFKGFGIGWATSPTSRGCVAFTDQDGPTTTNCVRTQATDRCFQFSNATALRCNLDLVSFNSDGLTLHDYAGNQSNTIYGIAMQVPQVYVTSFNTPLFGGNFDVTGCPFAPDCALFMSWARGASASIQDHAALGMGMAAGRSTFYMRCSSQDALGTSVTTSQGESAGDKLILLTDPAVGGTVSVCTLVEWLPDGIRLNEGDVGQVNEVLCCFMAGAKPTINVLGGTILGGKLGA